MVLDAEVTHLERELQDVTHDINPVRERDAGSRRLGVPGNNRVRKVGQKQNRAGIVP